MRIPNNLLLIARTFNVHFPSETHPRCEEEVEVFVQQRLVLRIISAEVLKESVG